MRVISQTSHRGLDGQHCTVLAAWASPGASVRGVGSIGTCGWTFCLFRAGQELTFFFQTPNTSAPTGSCGGAWQAHPGNPGSSRQDPSRLGAACREDKDLRGLSSGQSLRKRCGWWPLGTAARGPMWSPLRVPAG